MAAKTASLSVNIIADAAKAKAGLKDAESAFQKFKREVGATNGAMGVFDKQLNSAFGTLKQNALGFSAAAGAALLAFGASSVKAASNLNESMNAVQVTFGDASSSILEFSQGAADAVGMSQTKFNQFAVSFAGFAQNIGKSSTEVTQIIKDLATRTADFASVMNLDISEAARIFQSALAGETEPIRKFGFNLSAAAVESYALANGLARTKSEITESVKQVARYGLLMEATEKVAGDFKNTQDSLANGSRTLKEKFDDLQARIGQALIPVMEDLVGIALRAVEIFGKLSNVISDVAGYEIFGISIGDIAKNLLKFTTNAAITAYSVIDLLMASQGTEEGIRAMNDAIREGPDVMTRARLESENLSTKMAGLSLSTAQVTAAWEALTQSLKIQDAMSEANAEVDAFIQKWLEAMKNGKVDAKEFQDELLKIKIYLLEVGTQVASTATDFLKNQFRILVDTSQIERAITLLNSIATGGELSYGFYESGNALMSRIDGFAMGGIVTGPTVAMIGEDGPEAVIPLTKPTQAMQLIQESGLADMAVGMSPMPVMSSGSTVININAGSVVTENDLIESIRQGLVNAQRNGSRLVYSNT